MNVHAERDGDLACFEEERVIAFGGWTDPWTPTTMVGCRVTKHPNREIIDGSVTVVADGVQTSLHASARLDPSDDAWHVGPIRIDNVAGLQGRTVTVTDELSLGFSASVTFAPSRPSLPMPEHHIVGQPLAGWRRGLDAWGTVNGTCEVDGATIGFGSPDPRAATAPRSLHTTSFGTHDRPELRGELAAAPALEAPQRFFHRGVHWLAHGDGGASVLTDQDPVGASRIACGALDGGTHDRDVLALPVEVIDVDIVHGTGTRWPEELAFGLHLHDAVAWAGDQLELRTTSTITVPLLGLGEHHSTWIPGGWHDELAIGFESWRIEELDRSDIRHLHVVQFTHGTVNDQEVVAVVESLALGPHAPSGLSGFTDGWRP